jgi:cation-transporting ATPase E
VDVLCVDKTGTITEDSMTYDGIFPVPSLPFDKIDLSLKLGTFAASSPADNATMLALKGAFATQSPAAVVRAIFLTSLSYFSSRDCGTVRLGPSLYGELSTPFIR